MHLVATLAQLDDLAGAQKARGRAEGTATLLQLNPDFTAEYVTKAWPFRWSDDEAKIVNGLKKVGF